MNDNGRHRRPGAAARLRELSELSYREIAQVLDAPVGTVMSRLARARNMLRQQKNFRCGRACAWQVAAARRRTGHRYWSEAQR